MVVAIASTATQAVTGKLPHAIDNVIGFGQELQQALICNIDTKLLVPEREVLVNLN